MDLIAQGPERRHRWRRPLPLDGNSRWLGRTEGHWLVPWDACVSRKHAELRWRPPFLEVTQQPGARNPIYVNGVAQPRFQLAAGHHFVIGDTTFTLVEDAVQVSLDVPQPAAQHSFSPEALRSASFRHAQRQIQSLLRLPELTSAGLSDQDLWIRLVNLLLTGVSHAQAVALVARVEASPSSPSAELKAENGRPDWHVLHWDRQEASSSCFQPSASLMEQAITTGQSVMHRWDRPLLAEVSVTASRDYDWAFATPVAGQACRGMVLYVAGSSDASVEIDDELADSLKFAEFVSATVGSICDVRNLQRRAASLAPFFSPVVRDALAQLDPETALAPRETDVCVLFCDLRGFSRTSERGASDLMGLLERVSQSLGIVTGRILEQAGVIGDFHGDAAMGFWGWPLPQEDLALRGCQAALAIWQAFRQWAESPQHALSDFRVGMGLATGRAVAGRIGTVDQVKVTVFGPVVNIASRLEGMTRQLGASILLEENTARAAEQGLSRAATLRQVATIRPYGMDRPQIIYELQPTTLPESEFESESESESESQAAQEREDVFQRARSLFVAGQWSHAHPLFHHLSDRDPVSRFYLDFLRHHQGRPPEDWEGVIHLTSK